MNNNLYLDSKQAFWIVMNCNTMYSIRKEYNCTSEESHPGLHAKEIHTYHPKKALITFS